MCYVTQALKCGFSSIERCHDLTSIGVYLFTMSRRQQKKPTIRSEPIEEELDFDEFVQTFFTCPLGEPRSMSQYVSFDCETPAKVFEMLLVMFTEGLRRSSDGWQPGAGLQLEEIPADRLQTLTSRFAMIGVRPVIDIAAMPRMYSIDNSQYLDKANLADMSFVMAQGEKLYRISFQYL